MHKLFFKPGSKNSSTVSGCDYPGCSCLVKVLLHMGCFGIRSVLVQGLPPTQMHTYVLSQKFSQNTGLETQQQMNRIKNNTHICFPVF